MNVNSERFMNENTSYVNLGMTVALQPEHKTYQIFDSRWEEHAPRHSSPRENTAPSKAPSQVQTDPLVEGDGVAVAAGLPVAGHAGLHQQPLALVVVVSCHLVRQRGARAHNAHPFCQDENAKQDGDFAQVERIASNFDGAFRATWDALENRNST